VNATKIPEAIDQAVQADLAYLVAAMRKNEASCRWQAQPVCTAPGGDAAEAPCGQDLKIKSAFAYQLLRREWRQASAKASIPSRAGKQRTAHLHRGGKSQMDGKGFRFSYGDSRFSF